MKKLISIILLVLFSCSNDDDGTNSSLPELTFDGKNTFGCLIDGEVFLPRRNGYTPTPILNSFYKFDNSTSVNNNWFLITADNNVLEKTIVIEHNLFNIPFIEGNTYTFGNPNNGILNATYRINKKVEYIENGKNYFYYQTYQTSNDINGEITIMKLDDNENIISGIFWFDCSDSNGNIVKIREGRFDLKYKK